VADLVKWNVSSLKVDSVENTNVTRNFNLTHADWFHTSAVPPFDLKSIIVGLRLLFLSVMAQ
jgi:hypothetical protein